ncbi:MAG: hypothetical protein ACJ76Y_14945 [Thermoanaerobaculia bacterium]|jgi:hypothetical protein
MRKLLALSVLLSGLAFALPGPKPAAAVVYRPCNEICTINPNTRCSCPGTVQNTTCANQYFECPAG